MGEGWLVPVLIAGTLGGMLAKLANAAPLYDHPDHAQRDLADLAVPSIWRRAG